MNYSYQSIRGARENPKLEVGTVEMPRISAMDRIVDKLKRKFGEQTGNMVATDCNEWNASE